MNELTERMVQSQLLDRGITDARVIEAFRTVDREHFVPPRMAELAYADRALPIGHGQTISQPYIVARTLEALALNGSEVALEIGTGSGYVAALMSLLVREVYSVERLDRLAVTARERLARLGYAVHVIHGDGTLGWRARAPYDAIAVAASGPIVPPALTDQLADGGRMVIPVHHGNTELLVRVLHVPGNGLTRDVLEEVRFVPLIGAQGQPQQIAS